METELLMLLLVRVGSPVEAPPVEGAEAGRAEAEEYASSSLLIERSLACSRIPSGSDRVLLGNSEPSTLDTPCHSRICRNQRVSVFRLSGACAIHPEGARIEIRTEIQSGA